jgi:hypothetical protein
VSDLNDCIRENYTNNALAAFKKYKKNLNNIKIDPFNEDYDNIDNIVKYIKKLNKQIWDNISTKEYSLGNKKIHGIVRPNHGGLNHMRSLKFGLLVLKSLFNGNKYKNNQKLFEPYNTLVMLLCSLNFESIMRVDEEGSEYVGCIIGKTYFNRLYPSLEYEKYTKNDKKYIKASPHQIASSVFYTVLMKHCFNQKNDENKNKIIDKFSRCISFYKDPKKSSDFSDKDFLTYYDIITCGHYLDHCRGYGDKATEGFGGNLQWYRQLFYNFGVKEEDVYNIHRTIIEDLEKTEYKEYTGKMDDTKTDNIKKTCQNLSGRYFKYKFVKYSKDFEETWKVLNLHITITRVLEKKNIKNNEIFSENNLVNNNLVTDVFDENFGKSKTKNINTTKKKMGRSASF